MKPFQNIVAIILALAFIMILFITSFQYAMYGNFSWYERAYDRHNVLPEVDMTMEDLMYVTHEMMEYLVGRRPELSVITHVDGEYQDFFGEQDRRHMLDVKYLFLGGLVVRTISIIIVVVCVLILLITKADLKKLLPRAYQIGLGINVVLFGAFAIASAIDFNWVFIEFHHIFFDNDYWLFDPRYSYMIRVLPEAFFFDMVVRIGVIFVVVILLFLVISVILQRMWRRNENKQEPPTFKSYYNNL